MLNRTKLFTLTSIFIMIPALFPAPLSPIGVASSASSDDNLVKAASYLISMYNPTLGLVVNSEDWGINPLGASEGVPCNSTYWIYDDNLWAGWALQPFNPTTAESIMRTVQNYSSKYGRSMLFEVAVGEPVPTTIHSYKNIKVYDSFVNGVHVQILLDRHQYADNLGVFLDADEYEDLCCYMAIDYWMMGDGNASEHWFRAGEKMWNSTTNNGFYDKAAKSDGRYQNFKLGLFILAQKVTQFQSNITEKVETAAWRYQNSLGGIATQSWLNGSLYGTANAEATAALLLPYNAELVGRLHKRQTFAEYILEDTEAKLKKAEQDNKALRDFPWSANPRPFWFTTLLLSTFLFAAVSLILILKIGGQTKIRFLRTSKTSCLFLYP